MSSFVQSRRFTVCFAIFLLPESAPHVEQKCLMTGDRPATSLRQHYLTPLNLIAAETGRRLAM
jgi:hypothetical protein